MVSLIRIELIDSILTSPIALVGLQRQAQLLHHVSLREGMEAHNGTYILAVVIRGS